MSERIEFGEKCEKEYGGARISLVADKGDIARYLVRGRRQSGGWLCNADDVSASGDFFEVLLALTELCCTERLCIAESLPWACGKEAFEERSESLFRAAVYGGELSVMLYGYRSPREAEEAFNIMHKSFCRLEEEGREVSGYLTRGVMIDSPIALLDIQNLPRVDFVCFNFDRLSEGLLGYPVNVILNDSELTETLCRFWEDIRRTCLVHQKTEVRAISEGLFSSKLFSDWVKFMDIREVYTTKQSVEQKNT